MSSRTFSSAAFAAARSRTCRLVLFFRAAWTPQTVCALLRRKLGLSISTYSIGFNDEPEGEQETARAFAQHLETDHHELIIEPQGVDFLERIGRLLDEPNADSSCLPTFFLSGLARQHVTVAIGGDGGDEMFGGYNRYFDTLEDFARYRQGHRPDWTPGAGYYGPRLLVAEEAAYRGAVRLCSASPGRAYQSFARRA